MSVLKVNIQTLLISDINLSYSSENVHFSLCLVFELIVDCVQQYFDTAAGRCVGARM